MTQRSSSAIVRQIGIEGTPGAGGAANRLLATLSFMPDVKYVSKHFRAQGKRTTSATVKNKKHAEGSYEGVLDYNTIIYILDGLFNAATPAQIAALTAYTRLWTAGATTLDSSRRTFVVEKGDATSADVYAYCQLQSFSMEATQEDFSVKGSLIAQYPTLNQSLTASPTAIAERPVQRGDVNVYMDTTAGGIGTTQLTEAQREMIDIGEKFIAVWFHNRAKASWSDTVEKDYEVSFEFTLSHNSPSRALLAELANNPRKYIRWEAQGLQLGVNVTPVYELLQIDMAVDVEEAEEIGDSDGVYAYKYKATLVIDPALGSHLKFKSISALAAV